MSKNLRDIVSLITILSAFLMAVHLLRGEGTQCQVLRIHTDGRPASRTTPPNIGGEGTESSPREGDNGSA